MQKLNSEELLNINGGSHVGLLIGIIGIGAFIIGVIDGYLRPYPCRS